MASNLCSQKHFPFRKLIRVGKFHELTASLGDDVSFVRMYYNETVPIVHHGLQELDDVAKMVLSYKNYR